MQHQGEWEMRQKYFNLQLPQNSFLALAGNFLDVQNLTSSYARRLFLSYKRCAQDMHLEKNLGRLVADSALYLSHIVPSQVLDPVEFMRSLVYQMSQRITGAHEIADDANLLHKTYAWIDSLEQDSWLDAWFPMLPTPRKVSKIWAYTRMHWCLKRIVTHRRQTGKRETDGVQVLMDQDCSDAMISLVRTLTQNILCAPLNSC